MIKTYLFDDKTQLSAHFNVSEFRCKCGKAHDTLLADELVNKLEQLYSALNCSKIIVTSGFRCSMHDRSVGGDGTGQHTKGNAADICCYGQDGQPISSKTVCCKAQDIGFGGIANITPAYIYTHVDVRSGKRWYGNEVQGNSSVTDNFYEYFEGEDMKGIDVSVHNGIIDWQKVRADGISFAILRAGFGKLAKQKDERFEDNYAGAKAASIPVGAYWYSYAMTPEEAELEADVFLSVIKGKQFEFPVYFDLEEKKQFDLGKEKVSAIMRAFLERVEAAGYFVGLYGSASSLVTHIADGIKSRYTIWLAHWVDQTNYGGAFGIWQHSEKGKVAGINGNVDLDIGYKDFPTIIRAKGLNGYGKEEVMPNPPASAADDGVTVEVTVDGKKYSGKLNKA